MIDARLSYNNPDNKLVLEVRSTLLSIHDESCEQVWEVVKQADIKQGTFGLFVNKKITGQSNMTNAVKIIGPARNPRFLFLKFQTSASECYEGTLFLRVNGGEMEYASRLHEKLKEITGIGWFDPKFPEFKKVAPPLVPTEMPIARVETALFAATTHIVRTPSGGHRNLGKPSKTRIVPKALAPIATATARYARLMKIRSDIAIFEKKKSITEAKIAELKKKSERKHLLEAEAIVIAAGLQLAKS